MVNKYTEAQKRASLKYMADKVQIKFTVTQDQRERYHKLAAYKEKALTQINIDLLEKEYSENLSDIQKLK